MLRSAGSGRCSWPNRLRPSPTSPGRCDRAAGFDFVEAAARSVPLTLGADPTEAAEHLAETGPGRALLETVPPADRSAALEAVRAVLVGHVTPTGVELDGAVWLTSARRGD